jgi:hypothetical protein
VPSTLEVRTRQLLLQLLPIGESPGEHLEVLDIVSQVWEVFGRKCVAYRRYGCESEPPNTREHSLSRTDTTSSTSMGGPGCFSSRISIPSICLKEVLTQLLLTVLRLIMYHIGGVASAVAKECFRGLDPLIYSSCRERILRKKEG